MKNLKYRLIVINIFLLVFMITTISCNAQSAPQQSLLALSKKDHTLAIVDASTLK